MIAIEISTFGPPDVLRPGERPKPIPKDDEILVRVGAAGVARADTLQRQGKYPPPPGASDIPGLDIAGAVESIGASVSNFRVGDRVCAILAGGGYAEYCAVPAAQALPIPENWTIVEAATLPENIFTVYDNVITRAGLTKDQTILIHGGSSGIGSMAIMVSRAWGAVPFITAGSKSKCDACLGLGAEHAINYRETDFASEIRRLTAERGVDVILDMIGGPYLEKNIDSLAVEGRLAIVSTQGGRTAQLDLGKLMHKRVRVGGSTMRIRTPAQKGEVTRCLLRDIWPLLPAKNPIRPVIDKIFPLRDARLAHARLEEGSHIGKIVLVTDAQ